MLTINAKTQVYQARVLSTLLYGSESWTLYFRQEHRLNTSHQRYLYQVGHQDNRREGRGAVEKQASMQTSESGVSTIRRFRLYMQHLQQDLPLQDRALQPQSALHFHH
ncbi:hypothetical protein PoB_004366200 [Plakobranchus ocellatus]|uniref:Uncharacterized protein n=1 Tax=Plakobranchus ocellatus TaxID=259542 RepID=A0AAV4BD93_9GAST|nr:hypothetical protein PoB_004366200 [Plakobranchus ocellatus]